MKYWVKGDEHDYTFEVSWDDLFCEVAPELIGPISEYQVISRINSFIRLRKKGYFKKMYSDEMVENIRIYSNSFDKIKIQLRVLNLNNS